MGNLHLKIDFVTEAHIFNNVSRQKALVNLMFALKGATYREGLMKNEGRLLINIFSKMLPLSCAEHVEYGL